MSSQGSTASTAQHTTTTGARSTTQTASPQPIPASNSRKIGKIFVCLLHIYKWATQELLQVLKSFNKATVILSLVLAIVFGTVTWYGLRVSLRLATWTSWKDYLEYCHDNKEHLAGIQLHDCQQAILKGLPEPPLYRRAGAVSLPLEQLFPFGVVKRGIIETKHSEEISHYRSKWEYQEDMVVPWLTDMKGLCLIYMFYFFMLDVHYSILRSRSRELRQELSWLLDRFSLFGIPGLLALLIAVSLHLVYQAAGRAYTEHLYNGHHLGNETPRSATVPLPRRLSLKKLVIMTFIFTGLWIVGTVRRKQAPGRSTKRAHRRLPIVIIHKAQSDRDLDQGRIQYERPDRGSARVQYLRHRTPLDV